MKSNCPVCHLRGHSPDRRGRFGIIFSNDGSFGINCFNCTFHARWQVGGLLSRDLIWFLSSVGVSDQDIRELKFTAYREREAGDIFDEPNLKSNPFKKWTEHSLPENSYSLMEWAQMDCKDENFLSVAEYAISRGIDSFEDFYWTPDTEYQNNKRLIIPFKYQGKIVGHTGRYVGVSESKLPRYFGHTPPDFIFNIDKQFDDFKYCVLCEGVLDAYLIGGISCLGNSLSEDQIYIIKSLRKEVILCPDRDSSGTNLIDIAAENGWHVSFPRWDTDVKDAAKATQKYGKLLTLKSIIDSKHKNPLKIKIARKFDNFEE